ncbi:hypothetical protein KCV87_34270 [Actinosynnema pretiosum subsp. pretiosum]|uniref:Uncharacterized protein n=1 Tax=Actinosynnema pretiosum subsp. pretiosum TaxID=103721 RepID=A0AA45R470_9PSEU|nr:hypothetical protein KCV87_34270 [Actinosynnema pretiosum subsp. pretiosum]
MNAVVAVSRSLTGSTAVINCPVPEPLPSTATFQGRPRRQVTRDPQNAGVAPPVLATVIRTGTSRPTRCGPAGIATPSDSTTAGTAEAGAAMALFPW